MLAPAFAFERDHRREANGHRLVRRSDDARPKKRIVAVGVEEHVVLVGLERALPRALAAQPRIVVAAPLRGEMKGDRVPAKRQSRALDERLLRVLLRGGRASDQGRNLERCAAHVQRPTRQTAAFGVKCIEPMHNWFASAAVGTAAASIAGGVATVSAPTPFSSCPGNAQTVVQNAEVEPSLAVDPHRPARAYVAYQQDRFRDGAARGIVVATTSDAGRTWRR